MQHKFQSRIVIAAAFLSVAFLCRAPCAQDVRPRPEPPCKGQIGRTAKDSIKDFPQEVQAPKAAPNVLLIFIDGVGFGVSSTFGGPIPTPAMDRLADEHQLRELHLSWLAKAPQDVRRDETYNQRSSGRRATWRPGPRKARRTHYQSSTMIVRQSHGSSAATP